MVLNLLNTVWNEIRLVNDLFTAFSESGLNCIMFSGGYVEEVIEIETVKQMCLQGKSTSIQHGYHHQA